MPKRRGSSFCFFRKETMELSREFDEVNVLPIGEDVRHLDEPNENIINLIIAVYLRDSLINIDSRCPYTINCRRNDGELVRIMFDSRDWYFGRTPRGGVPLHPTRITRNDLDSCTVGNIIHPITVSEQVDKMTIRGLLWDICSWYVTRVKNVNNDIIPPHKFVEIYNSSNILPSNHYNVIIHAHSTWINSCNEKIADPTTSDYDVQRLALESTEYQSRINNMLAVRYSMLFAEQESK